MSSLGLPGRTGQRDAGIGRHAGVAGRVRHQHAFDRGGQGGDLLGLPGLLGAAQAEAFRGVAVILADAGIIRNRLKVSAAIHNAQVIVQLQNEHGSFKNWLDAHRGLSREDWTKLFGKTFKFTGGEIVNEFLMSTAYLLGAHVEGCRVGEKIAGITKT